MLTRETRGCVLTYRPHSGTETGRPETGDQAQPRSPRLLSGFPRSGLTLKADRSPRRKPFLTIHTPASCARHGETEEAGHLSPQMPGHALCRHRTENHRVRLWEDVGLARTSTSRPRASWRCNRKGAPRYLLPGRPSLCPLQTRPSPGRPAWHPETAGSMQVPALPLGDLRPVTAADQSGHMIPPPQIHADLSPARCPCERCVAMRLRATATTLLRGTRQPAPPACCLSRQVCAPQDREGGRLLIMGLHVVICESRPFFLENIVLRLL